jgi:tRNA(fMet)-specific endonuclease VapC
VREAAPAQLCISAVTRGELLYGLRLKDGAHRLEKVIEQFLARVRCLPWGIDAVTYFAAVAAELHRSGTPIGTMDAMIAGHALAEQAVLVSNNGRHFERVVGLKVEDWS